MNKDRDNIEHGIETGNSIYTIYSVRDWLKAREVLEVLKKNS